nr:transcriptional regulator [Enterococcus faecalis]
MVFVNRIAGYRKMLGKTQADMAKIFKISTQAYWQKEKRIISFSDEEKMLFKKMLQVHFPNITIDEIFFS